MELGWSVLAYPGYSPDFAPTDYQLFSVGVKCFDRKKNSNDKQIEEFVKILFTSKPEEFYSKCIEVILVNGNNTL